MKGFDYSSDNLYFVTICVKDMLCCFGEIIEGTSRDLSVQEDINKSNHSNSKEDQSNSNECQHQKMQLNKYGLIVQERLGWLPVQYPYVAIHNSVIMPNHLHLILEIDSSSVSKEIKIKSLSSLMGAFKTTASKLIHETGFLEFAWHRSFHDHIIRDDKAYKNIHAYIDENPKNWFEDDLFRSV